MKAKFDAYVLRPLAKRVQNWIVDRSAAWDISRPFYLPCKIWGLNFCMVQKIFIREKFYLFRCSGCKKKCMPQKCILCSFRWNLFWVFVQNFPKNANYEEFLTKFVNINNHTEIFFAWCAKNHSQHEERFEAWQIKRALLCCLGNSPWKSTSRSCMRFTFRKGEKRCKNKWSWQDSCQLCHIRYVD